MSTTPPVDGTADQPPSLAEVLAVWAEHTPDIDAPLADSAAWFALKVELLQPITTEPDHPDFERAREFERIAKHTVKSLRDKEAGR